MKILILDGQPDANDVQYAGYLRQLVQRLRAGNHSVTHTIIREQSIKYCTGCWSCWWKTPGRCFVQDDSQQICADTIHADFLLFASPVIMGFPSALLKKTQDKLIPLLHPYIQIVHKECHHRKRYESYPKLGLLLQKSPDTDAEDIKIITDIYDRFSLNFRSTLDFTMTTEQPVEEVFHAINHL
ncbi:MAG TPA: NAD(P)H-dependent oxidoreductase [bacterium]|nr:NAD(P)H-dependent oxidoreductase [bacterium]HPN41982.1 NAD(P)H-dependent oxidoreductase [bacterium]